MRVVLDTNVLVSAAFWGGVPRAVLDQVAARHTLCFTRETLEELRAVLAHPKFAPKIERLEFDIEEFLDHLTSRALILPTPPTLDVIHEDPADNAFLACALAAGADCLVSGDAHLRKLKVFCGILILTPRAFLVRVKGGPHGEGRSIKAKPR